MKISELKEIVRKRINELSINSIAKAQLKNADEIQKALEFYKKNKDTDKKETFVKLLTKLGVEKKRLEKEMDIAVSSKLRNVGYEGPLESVNESMELKKLKDAIKMFQDKIAKQGRVTNARDEEHLENLIRVYKEMGGKHIKESVNEAKLTKKGNTYYVDSNFVNLSKKGGNLKHLGMGDFAVDVDGGKTISFHRVSEKIPGFSGRTHRVAGNGDDFKKLTKLMGIKSESVNEEKVYIDFLNKKKGFKQDRIKFNSYEAAVKWAKKNFEKFNPDMIHYESVNEASRRAADFYGDTKHGKALHSFLKGKWDSKKVEKYLEKLGADNDVINARLIDFISRDAGLDTRKYKTLGEQTPALIKQLEVLYKDFLTESVNEKMDTMTKAQWNKTHKDYKSIRNGVHYVLKMTDSGTASVPVKIVEDVNESDVKKKINRRGDVDGLLVKHNGKEYHIVYSGDFGISSTVMPYGIVMPGDDTVSFLSKDRNAKTIWKQLKPKVDKFLKSNESVNESKLDFSKVKKSDKLIGKFPPYKEYEVISSNGKNSIIAKDLKNGNRIEINSVNNYKLKESVNEAELKLGVRYVNKQGKEGFIQTGGSTNPKNWFWSDGKTKHPYDKVKKELKPAKDQKKTGFSDYLKQGGRVWDNVNSSDSLPINESTEPQIITQLRDVIKNGYQTLKDPKTGKRMKVDSYSASAIVGVYDKLNPSNQEKFSKQGLLGMQSIAFKLIK